jgi:hypothetical protein
MAVPEEHDRENVRSSGQSCAKIKRKAIKTAAVVMEYLRVASTTRLT